MKVARHSEDAVTGMLGLVAVWRQIRHTKYICPKQPEEACHGSHQSLSELGPLRQEASSVYDKRNHQGTLAFPVVIEPCLPRAPLFFPTAPDMGWLLALGSSSPS